jgi:hypothetical protein
MSIRNGLLGFVVLFSMTGAAVAAPDQPIHPQVEGRESNPVDREYYRTEKTVERYESELKHSTPTRGDWVRLLNNCSDLLEEVQRLFR